MKPAADPLGRITAFGPPYRVEPMGPFGFYIIVNKAGVNCWAGPGGAVWFATEAEAQQELDALIVGAGA